MVMKSSRLKVVVQRKVYNKVVAGEMLVLMMMMMKVSVVMVMVMNAL